MCVLFIQTPPGVYCANRKLTKKIPDILKSQVYHYRLEIVSEDEGTVQTSIVSFDNSLPRVNSVSANKKLYLYFCYVTEMVSSAYCFYSFMTK